MNKAKKDIKYILVQNTDISQHCLQCTALLEEGYTPVGGPSVTEATREGSMLVITQAFIRENKKE